MRLPHIRRAAPEVLATAKAQRWDPAEVLRVLLAEEVAGRDRSALATRRARAAFPTGKTFDAWHEAASPRSRPPPSRRCAPWNGSAGAENLVVCGPAGTGKTFLLEALGQDCVEAGRHVAWFTLEALGVLVRRHRADDTVTKAIARILRADLVVIDDIGLLPVGADAAEGLYRLVDAAYETTLRRGQLEPAPVRLRRADAQDAGHRHRRPAPAPRPRLPDQRRQRAAGPSPRRQGGEPLDLTPGPSVATTGRSHGHHRADFVTVTGQFLVSLDTWQSTLPATNSSSPCLRR